MGFKPKKIMNSRITPEKINSIRNDLIQVLRASLHATRTGDFMRVARLTARAAEINRAIMDAESQLIAEL